MTEGEDWPAIMEQIELNVQEARVAGDIDAMIDVTYDALRRIDARLASLPEDEKLKTLHAVRRIGFNVAADIYPGWERGTRRDQPQLDAAAGFAKQSAAAVEQLGLGPAQRGNAVWLLGALDLARGNPATAILAFNKAAVIFAEGPEPEMQLMAQGYAAIANHSRQAYDRTLAALKNLGTEDAVDFQTQLEIAAQVFAL